MLVILEINILILFPKLELPCLLQWSLVPLHSYCQNSLHPVSQMETSPFPLSPPISTVTFLQFLRWNCSSHAWKVSRQETLPAAPVDTFCRTLIIIFLTVLPLSLNANLSLALQSAPWCVTQLLGLCKVSLLPHL